MKITKLWENFILIIILILFVAGFGYMIFTTLYNHFTDPVPKIREMEVRDFLDVYDIKNENEKMNESEKEYNESNILLAKNSAGIADNEKNDWKIIGSNISFVDLKQLSTDMIAERDIMFQNNNKTISLTEAYYLTWETGYDIYPISKKIMTWDTKNGEWKILSSNYHFFCDD